MLIQTKRGRVVGLGVDCDPVNVAAAHLMDGGILPVGGGVLIRDKDKKIIGAVGISGDTSDNDEAAGAAGIRAAGHEADGG